MYFSRVLYHTSNIDEEVCIRPSMEVYLIYKRWKRNTCQIAYWDPKWRDAEKEACKYRKGEMTAPTIMAAPMDQQIKVFMKDDSDYVL